jgi:Na+/H+ antiporter 1
MAPLAAAIGGVVAPALI